MNQFTVEEKDSGQRLDKYIARLIPLAPKSFIYKALRNKDIRLNEKKASGNEQLAAGDRVLFRFPDVQFADLGGRNGSSLNINRDCPSLQGEALQRRDCPRKDSREQSVFPVKFGTILYEDTDIILADKPAGVLSQKAKPEDFSMNDALLEYCGGKTETFTPSVCNRLDRNTSGLIIFAKTYRGAREMTACLRDRSASKYYLAAVHGNVTEGAHIKARLLKNERENAVEILPAEDPRGDLIETAYEPLCGRKKNAQEITLLRIELLTGKTHQIRAHLSAAGYPILGDPKYGKKGDGEQLHIHRMMLHSHELVLPGRGTYRTEVPDAFGTLFPEFAQR